MPKSNNMLKSNNMPKNNKSKKVLSKNRKKEIEKEVNKIIDEYEITKTSFIDISSIVKNNGFEIQTMRMPIDTTGCLFVNDSDNVDHRERLIVVNTIFKNPDNEKDVVFKKSRFITAHEYGHFILHKPNNKPLYAHRDSDRRDDLKEMEADYFARCILMPSKYFVILYEFLNDISNSDEKFIIEMLSKIFRVTQKKVRTRMEDLLVEGQ